MQNLILPGSRRENCAKIADCHGEEDDVGGGLHAGPAEDDDDDGVGDERDHGQDWHDDSQKGKDQLHGSKGGCGVDSVAGPELHTSEIVSGYLVAGDTGLVEEGGCHLSISVKFKSVKLLVVRSSL